MRPALSRDEVLFWLNERQESTLQVIVRTSREEGGNEYLLQTFGTLRHASSVITARTFATLSDRGVSSEELTDAYAVGEWSMLTLSDYPDLRGWTGDLGGHAALEIELGETVNLLIVDYGQAEEEDGG